MADKKQKTSEAHDLGSKALRAAERIGGPRLRNGEVATSETSASVINFEKA